MNFCLYSTKTEANPEWQPAGQGVPVEKRGSTPRGLGERDLSMHEGRAFCTGPGNHFTDLYTCPKFIL